MMNDDDLQAGQPLDEERRPVGLATFLERTWSGLTGLVRPRSAATMFRLADQYRHEGRYEEAADLITEGLAREIVHSIQSARKDTGCEYTDRIEVGLVTTSAELRQALDGFADYITSETLASKLVPEPLPGVTPVESKLGDASLQLFVRRVA